MRSVSWAIWLGLLFVLSVHAEDGFDEGFDETEILLPAPLQDKEASKRALNGYGSVDLESHYNTLNNKKLSSFKMLLDLNVDYKWKDNYKLKSNIKAYHDFIFDSAMSHYAQTPQGYENEITLNELSFEGRLSSRVDFKIGRQIVVWGKSDSIRVSDILNPLDSRNPGLVDIKNLRLGRLMSKLDFYANDFDISFIVLHENRFSKRSKFGSDFKPDVDLKTHEVGNGLKHTGLALSLNKRFEGADLAVYFADTYLDKSYLKEGELYYHNRSKMLGVAYSQAVSGYLLKAELAHFDTIKYSSINETKARSDFLLGIEYNGIIDTSLAYEIVVRRIHRYEAGINTKSNAFKLREEYQQAVRFKQSYLNQTLDLNAVVNVFGVSANRGGSVRVSLDYALDDEISLSVGGINYLSGNNPIFDNRKDNDRIFVKVGYAF
jgi:hypothetical protein